MANFDVLHKIAKAYTILLELITKNVENTKIELSTSIKKISERDTTQLDEDSSNDTRLKLEDSEKLDQVYMTILQLVIGQYRDIDSVEKLAELFRRTLSYLMLDRKPTPIAIDELFDLAIKSAMISNDFKLLIEDLKKTMYC